MVITNAKYIQDANNETSTVKVTVDSVDLFVPMDTGNRHYAEILKQVADSTITIADAD